MESLLTTFARARAEFPDESARPVSVFPRHAQGEDLREARLAARDRIKAILSLPSAAANRSVAEYIAFEMSIAPDEADAILRTIERNPAAAPAPRRSRLEEAMARADTRNPSIGDGDYGPPQMTPIADIYAKRQRDVAEFNASLPDTGHAPDIAADEPPRDSGRLSTPDEIFARRKAAADRANKRRPQ